MALTSSSKPNVGSRSESLQSERPCQSAAQGRSNLTDSHASLDSRFSFSRPPPQRRTDELQDRPREIQLRNDELEVGIWLSPTNLPRKRW
jgi:hypothetical protein